MKNLKKLCFVCGALLLFTLPLAACNQSADNDPEIDLSDLNNVDDPIEDEKFSLSYEITQTEFSYVESVNATITAYVTNVSGEPYTMSTAREFEPFVSVYNHEDTSYRIVALYTLDEGVMEETGETFDVANGERGYKYFYLSNPSRGIRVGSYDIQISFYDYTEGVNYSKTFENVITVTE